MFSEEQQQNRIRQEQMLYQQNRVPRKEKTQQRQTIQKAVKANTSYK